MDRISTTLGGLVAGADLIALGLPLVLFGVLVGFLAGMRDRLLLLGAAVPTALGLLVITHQVLGAVGIELPLLAVALIASLAAALFGLARSQYASRRRRATPADASLQQAGWPIWMGAAAGALLSMAAWLPGIRDSSLPPQANDDIWHGYLTARLADLHSITAGSVAPVFADRLEPIAFYPYGAHLAGATLRASTGATVPESLNALWAVGIGLMLPFGIAALVRALLPEQPWAAAYAALAAAAMPFFPYAVNGILPYALGLSVVPVLLALLVDLVRRPHSASGFPLVVGAVGLLVTHPAAAIVFVVAAALVIAEVTFAGGLAAVRTTAKRLAPIVLMAALLSAPFLANGGGAGAALPSLRNQTVSSVAKAAAMVLKLQTPWTPGQPLLAVLVVAGLTACVLRRGRGWSLLLAYAGFAILFIGAVTGAAWSVSLLRPWYGEWYRLAAVTSLLGSVFAGIAGDSLHTLAGALLPRRAEWRVRLALACVAALALFGSLGIARSTLGAQSTVASAWHSPRLVTPDDVTLFRDLARRVGTDDGVLNNWQDGSTWMYAIAGVRPAIPYDSAVQSEPVWRTVLNEFPALGSTPASCQLLLDHHVTYAIAKTVTVHRTENPWVAAADAHKTLFKREFAGPSGSVYRLDQQALAECAGP